MLVQDQTTEDIAAENAAFEASFNDNRDLPTPTANSVVEPVAVVEPAEPVEPVEPVVAVTPTGPTEPVAVAEPAEVQLIAGLTNEQVQAALARSSQLQTTVDKMAGRLGSLMQTVEQLKSAPKTNAERQAFDLKLEKLSGAFPELAELLREDLRSVGGGAAEPAAPVTPVFTQVDVDRMLTEKLAAFQQQQEVAMEVRALGAVHPDWEKTIRTPAFALWRDNVISDGAELMQSENAAFISRKLTEFSDWAKSTQVVAAPQPVATAQPVAKAVAQPSRRLANAVLPQGGAAAAATPVTEDDAFAAAFAKVRGN